MIDYLFWFPVVWVMSFVFHEYMHVFEHNRQTGRDCTVELWYPFEDSRWLWWVPSMHVVRHGIEPFPRLVELAGGLYTSFMHMLVICVYTILYGFVQSGFTFSVICVGLIQFFYGYYEMSYLSVLSRDDYMRGHYILYFVVFAMFCVVWF